MVSLKESPCLPGDVSVNNATRLPERNLDVLRAFAVLFVVATHTVWPFTQAHLGPIGIGTIARSGVLAYWLAQRVTPRYPAWCWPLVLLGTTGVFLTFCRLSDVASTRGWLACVLLGIAIPFVRDLPENMMTRGARWIAMYSYGIYLAHVPVAAALSHTYPQLFQNALPFLTSMFMATLVVAWLGYYLIERPLIGIGARLAERWAEHRRRVLESKSVMLASEAPAP